MLDPLGIPSFRDKILQEAIRMILNAIYEPEFKVMQYNFGFRPSLGVQDAINHIQKYAKSMEYAIEDDIQGAFDNVDFEILIHILRKRILDETFISLIRGGLKYGINYSQQFEETKICTTQGSVLSPLLYNIYFNEFDKYIFEKLKISIDDKNVSENHTPLAPNRFYTKLNKSKLKLKFTEMRTKLLEIFKEHGSSSTICKQNHAMYKITKNKFRILDKIKKPSRAKSRQTIRFLNIRYADDCLFLTKASLEQTIKFKDIFSEWIQTNLTLSVKKTKITMLVSKLKSIAGKIHFLDFQLSYYSHKRTAKIGKKKSKIQLNEQKIIQNYYPFNTKKSFYPKIY